MTITLWLAAVTGIPAVVACWIAALDRNSPKGDAWSQFTRLLNARKSEYGRTGWIAINVARVGLPTAMILVLIDFIQHT